MDCWIDWTSASASARMLNLAFEEKRGRLEQPKDKDSGRAVQTSQIGSVCKRRQTVPQSPGNLAVAYG
jgi:hypothetical protein